MRNNSELCTLSVEMAVNVFSYYEWLTKERHEHILSKQFLRSGTSIGANIHEAYYASSKADFINKLQIALKEASETDYWLIVLERTGFFREDFLIVKQQCTSLIRLLTASINTAKTNI